MQRFIARLGVLLGVLLITARCAQPLSREMLVPGLVFDHAEGAVHIDAVVALDEGWLEQVACLEGTRDHEVLMTTSVAPSAVHAALLLAGAHSGRPGSWSWVEDALVLSPPEGSPLDVLVDDGSSPPRHVGNCMQGEHGEDFPQAAWVFAGSTFKRLRDGREIYEADQSGSLVGLVTFGDEVVAWPEVLPDQTAVQAPLWQVRSGALPPPGTAVTLILRPRH